MNCRNKQHHNCVDNYGEKADTHKILEECPYPYCWKDTLVNIVYCANQSETEFRASQASQRNENYSRNIWQILKHTLYSVAVVTYISISRKMGSLVRDYVDLARLIS